MHQYQWAILGQLECSAGSGLRKGNSTTCTWGPSIVLPPNTTSYTDLASSSSGSGTYKYQVRPENTIGHSVWIGAQVSVQ